MNRTYQFTRLQIIAHHVQQCTKEQLLRFYDKYIATKAPCRRKLSVLVFATQHQEHMDDKIHKEETSSYGNSSNRNGNQSKAESNVVTISDPLEFKKSMQLFSLPTKVEVSVIRQN